MSNIKTNPYEENTLVLNSFFKRPIVLLVAIFNALVCVGITVLAGLMFSDFLDAWIMYAVAIFPLILQYMVYLLFFVRARRKTGLKSPVAVLKASGIYSLVLCVLNIAFWGYHWGITIYRAVLHNYHISIALLVICIVVLGVFLVYSISKLIFAKSLKKSMNSIYLNSKGATAYGVCNLLLGLFVVITMVFYAVVMIMNYSYPFYFQSQTAVLVLTAVVTVLLAVAFFAESLLAFKYANFVSKMSSNFVVVPQIKEEDNPFEGIEGITPVVNETQCTGCGKKLNPDDAFCPACGTSVKK